MWRRHRVESPRRGAEDGRGLGRERCASRFQAEVQGGRRYFFTPALPYDVS